MPVARLHGPLSAGARRGRVRTGPRPRLTPRSQPGARRSIRSCRDAGAGSRRLTGRGAVACRSGSLLPARAALCGGLLFWASTSLNAASDRLQAQALASLPSRMPQVARAGIVLPLPPPPTPPEPTALDRLRASLQPDIDRRAVSLLGTPATPIIRIADHAMFASGGAVVQAAVAAAAGADLRGTAERGRIAAGDRLHR